MLKKENSRGFDGSSNNWARVCDSCHSVTCTVYCRADSTYLCSGCDARMHAASLVASHHKRVWICEACKRAPAAFLCKADVASLCASCNADIHSANLLAHRHHRVPIVPIPEYLLKFSKSTIAIESKKRKKEAKISSMLKKENSWGFDGSNNWGRVCDSCHSTACTIYCRADSSYLCEDYDIHIHAANLVASSHERVCVCEACECAPAAFLCKADAASLCASCDADIHSVNPLGRRHHRVPVMPIPGSLYGPSAVDTIGGGTLMIGGPAGESTEDYEFLSLTQDAFDMTIDEEDEDEAVSWLLLNPPVKNSKSNINNNNNNQSNNYGMLFGGELVDDFLDLAEYGGDSQFNDQYSVNQQQQHFSVPQKSYGGDSVVPIQDGQGKSLILYHQRQQQQSHHLNFMLGMKYDNSNTRYGYPATMSHNVSISSMDVSVVPESALNETSNAHPQPPKGNIDLFPGPPVLISPQLTPLDREARVLRYREKRKNRKFEKTIRYASRKAYAETRPRIKGRFAKRTDVEAEVDQMFSTQLMADSSYGIVPSF